MQTHVHRGLFLKGDEKHDRDERGGDQRGGDPPAHQAEHHGHHPEPDGEGQADGRADDRELAIRDVVKGFQMPGTDIPVHRDERLRDRELGILDGLTGHGVQETAPEDARDGAPAAALRAAPPTIRRGSRGLCSIGSTCTSKSPAYRPPT